MPSISATSPAAQLERGCGKTTFCHHIDGLRRSRPAVADTAIRVHYGNDLYGYIPGNFTWSVTDSFRADRHTGKTITGNIPFLSTVTPDKKRALAQHLEFFLVHRRRLFGDRRLVLVIDAVDESPLQNEAPILDFIPAPESLEPGIFILITARTDGELQPAMRRRLSDMPATRKLVIKRDEPASLQLLEAYLHKTNTPRILWNHFLTISDQRFLYLRALVGALALFGARRPDDLPRGSALIEALLDKLGRIYGRHSEHLYDIVTAITFAYEALSVEEICFLISERYPSLRTAAFLRDLSGVLRIDRSERGAVYAIAHHEIARALRVRFAARQEFLLRPWMDSLRDGADEVLKEPSSGLDYLLAHVDDYAASIAIVLPVSEFADRLVSYACRDGAFPAGDRRRQILLSAFRALDRADDAEAYLAAAVRVRAPILVEVLEQRLTERDSVLSRLQKFSDLSRAATQTFFRALAVACYQTQDYTAALSLSDRLYSVTQSTPDLINLALMLKGTDASVDGAYTMARARVIAGQLLADRHADALSASQRGYALYTIGRIFGDTMEHLSEAVPLFEESLRAFEGAEDELGALAVRNSIALSALDSGEFGKAAGAIREVVAVLQSRPREFPSHMTQAALVNWYVLSYLAGDEIADPIEASTIHRWEVRAYHLNNRFLVEYAKGNLAEAEAFADECLDLTEDRKGVYSRAAILNNTGVAFGRHAHVDLAHDICKASGYSIGQAIASRNLGLTSGAPSGVLRVAAGLLWPCSKNFDMLVPVLHV
ncbi:hypothetical protein HAP48_0000370 (plasmid) [Bradyrhizobium septentrionale]|uniref:Uncharacterized protein n=1 Tax=Bradyrhizobium septentrionale TaxID=1404411 RepID=A0A974A5P7_9BRAD|nr:hypothetical protein [Bradyrhizobium septentrionale]UGY11937.1 hypothetical protein HAP48_0000370 [Bradyrhizobium septentrionale]